MHDLVHPELARAAMLLPLLLLGPSALAAPPPDLPPRGPVFLYFADEEQQDRAELSCLVAGEKPVGDHLLCGLSISSVSLEGDACAFGATGSTGASFERTGRGRWRRVEEEERAGCPAVTITTDLEWDAKRSAWILTRKESAPGTADGACRPVASVRVYGPVPPKAPLPCKER